MKRSVAEIASGEGSVPKKTKSQSTSKHLVGYDSEWEKDFPWLELVTDESGNVIGCFVDGVSSITLGENSTTQLYGATSLALTYERIASAVIVLLASIKDQWS